MPEWMHNRAEHILAKNPSMPKSEAFAIATQQGHALHKNPKGYGTARGRHEAKAKFDTPKDDVKKANPGGLESPKMEKKGTGFTTEYDGDGNMVGFTTREQELNSILGRDRSFGFGDEGGLGATKMSAMRRELMEIAKMSMPVKLLNAAAQARGFVPGKAAGGFAGLPVLNQAANTALDPSRRRDLMRGAV